MTLDKSSCTFPASHLLWLCDVYNVVRPELVLWTCHQGYDCLIRMIIWAEDEPYGFPRRHCEPHSSRMKVESASRKPRFATHASCSHLTFTVGEDFSAFPKRHVREGKGGLMR
jgi:hypothetical protein